MCRAPRSRLPSRGGGGGGGAHERLLLLMRRMLMAGQATGGRVPVNRLVEKSAICGTCSSLEGLGKTLRLPGPRDLV